MHGKSEKKAASDFGVPRQTLRRHLEKARNGDGVEKVLGRPTILARADEDKLVGIIINVEKRLFGLTKMDIRRLAYRYCEVNNINIILVGKQKVLRRLDGRLLKESL